MVELAEALGAPGGRQRLAHELPQHARSRRARSCARRVLRDADAILLLEVNDPWGNLNSFSDPYKTYRPDHQAGRQGHHDLDAGRVSQVQLPGLPALHAGRRRRSAATWRPRCRTSSRRSGARRRAERKAAFAERAEGRREDAPRHEGARQGSRGGRLGREPRQHRAPRRRDVERHQEREVGAAR